MFHTDPSLLARRSNLAQRGTAKAHWRAREAARARWHLKHEKNAADGLQTPGKRPSETNAQDKSVFSEPETSIERHEIDETLADIWVG